MDKFSFIIIVTLVILILIMVLVLVALVSSLVAKEDHHRIKAAKKAAARNASAAAKQKQKAQSIAAKQEHKAAAVAAKQERKNAAKKARKIWFAVIGAVCAVVVAVPLVYSFVIVPARQYSKAVSMMEAGQYENAIAAFDAMDGYRDSMQQIEFCKESIQENAYLDAVALLEQGAYQEAITAFEGLGEYKDSAQHIAHCLEGLYQDALALLQQGAYQEAITAFEALDGYQDSAQQIAHCQEALRKIAYVDALLLVRQGNYQDAMAALQELGDYKDCESLIQTCKAQIDLGKKDNAIKLMQAKKYMEAIAEFEKLEAQGINCDAEIQKCEIGYLSNMKDKRYARVEPYVTRGEPTGNPKKVNCSADGTVKVHSVTRVDLNNGCVRFSIDCTPPKCEYISFFNPPSGSIFMFYQAKDPEAKRQTLVFDILREDIKATRELTLRFGDSGGFIFVRNPY